MQNFDETINMPKLPPFEFEISKKNILQIIRDELNDHNNKLYLSHEQLTAKLDVLEHKINEMNNELKKYLSMIIRLYEKIETKPKPR